MEPILWLVVFWILSIQILSEGLVVKVDSFKVHKGVIFVAQSIKTLHRGSFIACGNECSIADNCFHFLFDPTDAFPCSLYIDTKSINTSLTMPATATLLIKSKLLNGDFVMEFPTTGIVTRRDAYDLCLSYGLNVPPPSKISYNFHVFQGFTGAPVKAKTVFKTLVFKTDNNDVISEVYKGMKMLHIKHSPIGTTYWGLTHGKGIVFAIRNGYPLTSTNYFERVICI